MDSRRDKIIKKAQSILDKYKITPSKKGTARVEANDALSKELFMDEEAIQIKEFQSIGKFSNTIIHNVKKIVVDVSTGYNLRVRPEEKKRPDEIYYYIIEFSGFNPTFPKTTYFHNKYIQPNETYYTKDGDGVWRKKQSTTAPEISDESSTDSDETDDDDNEMQFGKLVKPQTMTSEIPYQLFDLGTDGTIIVGSLEDHVRYYLLDLLNKIKKIWNKEPKDSKDSRRNLRKEIETIPDVILRSKFKMYVDSIVKMRNKAIENNAEGTSALKTKEDKKNRIKSLKKENKEKWKDRTGYYRSGLEYIFEQAASTEGSEKVGVVLTDTSYQIYRRTSRDEDGNIISIELIRIPPDKRIKERKMGNEIYREQMDVDSDDGVQDDFSSSSGDNDSSGEDEDDNNSASDDSGFDSDYSNDDASNSDSEDEDEDGNKISLNRRDPVETRSKDK